MYPSVTRDRWEEIEQEGRSWYKDQDVASFDYSEYTATQEGFVDVLFFCYRTSRNKIHKIKETKTGSSVAIERDESFEAKKVETSRFEKTHKIYDVVYEGAKILGCEEMLEWKLMKNMIRPKENSPKVIMPYSVASVEKYRGKIYSTIERVIPHADRLQHLNLKIQQAIQSVRPGGIYIDGDSLMEIDMGKGTSYGPAEAIDMYNQIGCVVGTSKGDDGSINPNRVPIQELQGSNSSQIQTLFLAYEHEMNQIRSVTGINEARDAATPHRGFTCWCSKTTSA